MITRLVKMTFDPEKTGEFEQLFEHTKDRIRAFPGCSHVELLQSSDEANIYFTLSKWDRDESLQAYRKSDLFATTWSQTKALFAGKPLAWSTETKAVGGG